MEIRYLFHSGFAVDTGAHLLIFDYYKDTPRGGKLADGVIDPAEISGRDVVVFASHSHGDHYSPVIFGWRGALPRVRYVLSDDIRTREEAFRIGPGETLDLGDLSVRALRSTDAGAAFLVRTDGKTVFHAGDLNWWHWNGESRAYNDDMGRRYREQIDLLQGEELAADNWYREKAPRNPQHLKVMKRYQYFTQAMVELSRGEEQQALITLAPLDTYCKNCSRYIDSIHLHLLAGIALFRMGEDRWRAEVCAALDTAWEFRFVRTVSQYGAAVLPLLEGCGWRGDETFLYTLVRTSREQASLYSDYLHPRQEMTAPLSATELQVLRLICADKSNAEIGEILNIRVSTVKSHVSSVRSKLGVNRRSEARTAAKKLWLISEDQ